MVEDSNNNLHALLLPPCEFKYFEYSFSSGNLSVPTQETIRGKIGKMTLGKLGKTGTVAQNPGKACALRNGPVLASGLGP